MFHDIDYIFLTIRLLKKDYAYLAERLIPISQEQMDMSMADRAAMLRTKTKIFAEEDIARKFK